jgi:hypothetical protein
MTLLRLLILAVVFTLGTVLVGWWVVPLVGAAYGAAWRSSARPGLVAALAAAAGWGGYLSILALGGAPVARFAGDLAHAMSLPSWGPHAATLLFPALLAGPAAHVASRLIPSPNRKRSARR